MMSIRKSAVAGQFYFGCPGELSATVTMLLEEVDESQRSEL
jgi:predicted class III extradiol MEMO1 family dioxygenase